MSYVAVTRARNELYLLNTSNRMLYGRTETRQISRFANEIPQDCCDRTTVKDSKGFVAAPVSAYAARHNESRNNFLENIRAGAQKTQSSAVFEEGDRIKHPMFGEGEILNASPMGGDVLYEIEFTNGSVKRLMGNYAKLTKI